MSAGQAFVGIDAGTTGCTVMIFDESGNRLGQGYQEYPCTSPRPGWIEQDVEEVWRGICEATQAGDGGRRPARLGLQVGRVLQPARHVHPARRGQEPDRAVDRLERRTGAGVPGEVRQGDLAGRLPHPHRHAALAAVVGREDRLAARQRARALPADALVRQRPGVLPAPARRRRLGHRPGVADPQRHARHREARLERPRPRDVRHRPRPGAAGRHPVGSGRGGLGGRALRHGPARGPAGLPGRGRPAVRRHRRRRGGAGHGRVHRGHRRASWSPTSTASTASRAATCGGAATPFPAPGTSRVVRSPSARR